MRGVWRRNKDANAYIVARLYYNGNHLSYVEDAAGRKTQFGYSNSSAIVMNSIRFPDDNTVSYAFSLNNSYYRITEARDNEKGYKINYEYQDGHPLRVLRFKESVKDSAGNWIEGQKVNCYQYGGNYSRFRYFDIGDTSSNGKMVTLHYFDNVGRTVNTITMNAAETEVLGVSAGEYTKNNGTSANNNRLLSAASAGVQTTNLLIDSGLEYSNLGNNWTSSGNGSISYVSASNGQSPHSGNKMMKLTLTDNSIYKAFQSVYLKGGTTYVLSAYVNSLGATTFDTSEAYLEFESSSGASLGVQSNRIKYYTNSNISNGWARLEVSFTPSTSGTYRAEAVLENWIGTILFDDFQLEAVPDIDTDEGGAGTVNLLQYGSMEKQTGSNSYSTAGITNWWTYTTSEAVPSSSKAHTGKYSMTFAPSMSAKRRAKQTIQLNSKANKTFVLSAWGWTPKTNLYDGKEMEGDNSNEARFFGIIAKLEYENNAYDPDYFYLSFNGDISNWQYASTMIVPKQAEEHPNATVSQITLSAALDYCANRAYIDDISLTAEPVQTYKYDNDGNLVSASDSEGKTTVDRDDYDRIEKYTALNNVVYDLHYPSNNTTTQNPDTITCDGVVTTKEYKAGLETKTTVQKNGSNLYTESSAALNGTKDFYASVTDVNGITAKYYYNELKGLLTSSVAPDTETDRKIHFNYYADNDRPKSTFQEGVASITRYYADNGLLSRIKRKTFRNGNEVYQAYNFSYNDWGQRTKITVNNGSGGTATILASYGYDSKGRQTALAYGYDLNDSSSSGEHISYEYDLLDRPVHKVYYSGSDTVEGDYHYVYDAQGNLSRQYAMGSGSSHSEEYQFEYDSLGRLIRSQELTPEGYIKQRTEHVYDTANRLSSQAWTIGNNSFSETYYYNDPSNNSSTYNDGSLFYVKAATGDTLLYGYDDLRRVNRVTTKNTSNAEIFYAVRSFERFSGNINRTKDRVSAFSYRKPNETLIAGNTYSYDTCGNISQIGEMVGNTSRTQATYTYDNQDQLTQEVRYNYIGNSTTPTSTDITNYTYDTAGNLLQSSSTNSDSLITTNISYSYGDNIWRDRLTEINVDGTSKKIAYEGQTYNATNNTVSGTAKSGNPINWYNGVLYTNLTWTQGRRLSSLTVGSTSISYTYDMEGIRSSKIANGVTHNYITQNGRVVRETVNSSGTNYTLDFIYDVAGKPYAMIYTNSGGTKTTFYYVLNAQGDVVKLINSYGTVYASYTYDAWGNILTAQSHNSSYPYLHDTNPLRYRGYYYDTETGWYYLQSRYYDPVVKRFLNADCLATTMTGFIGCNMFAYCNNNPVSYCDPSGYLFDKIVACIDEFVSGVNNNLSAASQALDYCVHAAEMDGASPFLDILGVAAAAAIVVGAVGYTLYQMAKPRVIDKAEDIPNSDPSDKLIYRWGGAKPGNLTPKRDIDLATGLSFSPCPRLDQKNGVTTVSAINSTGVLYAYEDPVTGHVSVFPIGGTMKEWRDQGPNSIWTKALQSVVIEIWE